MCVFGASVAMTSGKPAGATIRDLENEGQMSSHLSIQQIAFPPIRHACCYPYTGSEFYIHQSLQATQRKGRSRCVWHALDVISINDRRSRTHVCFKTRRTDRTRMTEGGRRATSLLRQWHKPHNGCLHGSTPRD
jgi:hypothetical protein